MLSEIRTYVPSRCRVQSGRGDGKENGMSMINEKKKSREQPTFSLKATGWAHAGKTALHLVPHACTAVGGIPSQAPANESPGRRSARLSWVSSLSGVERNDAGGYVITGTPRPRESTDPKSPTRAHGESWITMAISQSYTTERGKSMRHHQGESRKFLIAWGV
jgi:hypothetical protein